MALISRITRLFKADLHDVIDQLEEPQLLLKQSIREMVAALDDDRQQLNVLQQRVSQSSAAIGELEADINKIEAELDVCFNAENEALARVVLRRKLESQQLLTLLSSKHKTVLQNIADLQTRIADHAPRLTAMQQKLELFVDERSHHSENGETPSTSAISDADVEVALLREQQRRGVQRGGV